MSTPRFRRGGGVILHVVVGLFASVFLGRAGFLFLAFLRQRVHFLLALLALEMTRIMLLARVIIASGQWVVAFVLLAVGACEARLGLAVLVLMVRAHGNDLLTSLGVNAS